MMRIRLSFLLFLLLWFVAVPLSASHSVWLRGTEYQADTVYHASIGPGTTQTTLTLVSGSHKMKVYYATVDLLNPNVDMHLVKASDRFASTETLSSMSSRMSAPGGRYFLGLNGGFFHTGGTNSHGESWLGTPVGACVANGLPYRLHHWDKYSHFVVGTDKAFIDDLTFSGTIKAPNGSSVDFGGVNGGWDSGNKMILYTSAYLSTTDCGGATEVPVRFTDRCGFRLDRPFRVTVVDEPNSDGDTPIPAGGMVLSGYGSAPAAFAAGLSVGDVLTVDVQMLSGSTRLPGCDVIASCAYMLRAGEVTDTEGYVDHFAGNQPRSAVGVDESGTRVILMTVDGRSTSSDGCRTTLLAELMAYAGAYDALNLDGGGSSELYSNTFGVLNSPSDGRERAVSNGIFAIYNAPDDSVVSSISFVDWAATLPVCGVYKPKFYGYNRYGMLIDTDLRGVVLDGLERLGEVRDDGTTFVALHGGTGTLTAHYGEITAGVPLTVVGSTEGLSLLRDSVLVDGLRPYEIELVNTVGATSYAALPALLQWTSDDETVATVDAAGVVRGVADGRCTLTGRTDGFECVLPVTVEIPRAAELAVPDWAEASSWSVTQSGAKNGTVNSDATGLTYSYAASSSRAPKVVFTGERRLYSIPDSVVLTFAEAMSAPVSSIQVGIRPANGRIAYVTEPLEAGVRRVALAAEQWATDRGAFPLTLVNIQFHLSGQTVGQAYTLGLSNLACIYPVGGGVYGDINADGVADVTDLSVMLNMVIGLVDERSNADLNSDGVVDVTDVNILINSILQ